MGKAMLESQKKDSVLTKGSRMIHCPSP